MDFEADSRISVSEEKLKELSKLATQQLFIEQEIENKKQELEQLNKTLRTISEVRIPEAMQNIGMSEFALTNGAKIKVKPYYSGKIDKDNKEAAFSWLNKEGHGALIKKELSLDFGNSEGIDWAYITKKIKSLIYEAHHVTIESELNEGVHHATLNAFIKEQVEGGKGFPLGLFNAYIGNRSKISLK